MSAESLTGRLLVATPQIEEGLFYRSVVLILDHGLEGSQGVVLNRPLEAEVDAILPGWQALATQPGTVFHGGPVQTDSALGLVSVPGEEDAPMGIRRLFGGLGVVDLDAPPPLVASEVSGLRIFAGYAGWTAGQLEEEIRTGSWYVVDAEARDAFTDIPHDLWVRVLRRQQDELAFVSTYPHDPTLN
ncbi:MAG: YqgE/AlgH family protein [Actinomycetia bacterium]|nr:YqgE/AlgH family protein [Actinomycetes bacterium]